MRDAAPRPLRKTNNIRTGVLCIILCFALGIANIFHFDIIILWSVLCLFVFTHSFLLSLRTQQGQHPD